MKVVDLKQAAAGEEHEAQHRVTFDEFYQAYPRKRARLEALKAWAQVSVADRHKILPAIQAQKKSDDWRRDDGRYIPYPASWLRGRRWEDELDTDLGMGQCCWNIHGNRGPEGQCPEPATMEKRDRVYCKRHGEQIS